MKIANDTLRELLDLASRGADALYDVGECRHGTPANRQNEIIGMVAEKLPQIEAGVTALHALVALHRAGE